MVSWYTRLASMHLKVGALCEVVRGSRFALEGAKINFDKERSREQRFFIKKE
jgi:hypothetical protein